MTITKKKISIENVSTRFNVILKFENGKFYLLFIIFVW